MKSEIELSGLHKDFESLKKTNKTGMEYWEARELMPLLGYERWENAEETIKRAERACLNSGQATENHFRKVTKTIPVAPGTPRQAERQIWDYQMSRYGCYLVAQNGDSSKPEIALAQTYFAVQTRKQELFEQLPEAEKRLYIRGEVSEHNKKLFSTAKRAGVNNFGVFNDAGYRGLYGSSLADVEKKKGVKKGDLLDRAGATELAANLFRITQTDEKLQRDGTKGESAASRTHFMVGGKVRQTIKDIGGTLPEQLPVERHIREIKSEQKRRQKLLGPAKSKNKKK